MLSTIAETNCKLNYFLTTIPNIRHLLLPLERTIRNKFIPAVKGGLVDISTLTGVSNWLIVFPVTEFGFELSKQQFWDNKEFLIDVNVSHASGKM